MYFNNANWLLSFFYPSLIWRKKTNEKVIYLTFDDGPIPEITDFVLDELDKRSIQATFFCVGDNIRKYPEVFSRIISCGHKIGNHTFNHLKGWKTEDDKYFQNIHLCDEIIAKNISGENRETKKLFRPPYGLIKKTQIDVLKEEYDIVMWDVLTGDFNTKLSPKDCLRTAIKYTRNGSIVIFHDSIKAEPNLSYALPLYLDHFISLGYKFEVL